MKIYRLFDKIKNNELCPCGSDIIYSKCCKNKKSVQNKTKKPINILLQENLKKSEVKTCLYHNKSECKGDIKNAHTIQNNKILSLLAKSSKKNEVYIFDVNKANGKNFSYIYGYGDIYLEMFLRSRHKATTRMCFCDKHDTDLFRYIEHTKQTYDKNDVKQKFLYAYKSFIFDYYKECVVLNAIRKIFQETPEIAKRPEYVRYYRKHCCKLESLSNNYYSFFSEKFDNNDFTGIETITIEFNKSIGFTASGFSRIPIDLTGNKIENYDKKNKSFSYIMTTVIPEEKRSYILFSYLKDEAYIYGKLLEQIKNSSKDFLEIFFSLLLPILMDDIIISEKLYNALDEKAKFQLTTILNVGDDYSRHKYISKISRMKIYNGLNLEDDYSRNRYLKKFSYELKRLTNDDDIQNYVKHYQYMNLFRKMN